MCQTSLVVQTVKRLPIMRETQVQSLGRGDRLKKGMVTHSSILSAPHQKKSPKDFPGGSDGKACVYNVGDPGSIPGLGRSPGEGNGNPLQYYCLENPYSPWGRKESDTTERLHFHFLTCQAL